MVCETNPCPDFLPKVGDSSPIVGDDGNTSNMNLIATGYSGGRKSRRSRRTRRHRKSHRQQRKSRRGGTLEGGKRKRSARRTKKAKHHRRN